MAFLYCVSAYFAYVLGKTALMWLCLLMSAMHCYNVIKEIMRKVAFEKEMKLMNENFKKAFRVEEDDYDI